MVTHIENDANFFMVILTQSQFYLCDRVMCMCTSILLICKKVLVIEGQSEDIIVIWGDVNIEILSRENTYIFYVQAEILYKLQTF